MAPEKKPAKFVTRQALAVEFGVTAGTITRWERDGCPVAKKTARGRPSMFAVWAVREWRDAVDTLESGPGKLSLEYERAKVAHAQAEKIERENLVRAGELVEREAVVLEGQSYTKAWATKVRAFPRRLVQAGLIAATHEAAVADVCRDLLTDIAAWRVLPDVTAPSKRRARKARP